MKIYYNQGYRPPEITGKGDKRRIIRLPNSNVAKTSVFVA